MTEINPHNGVDLEDERGHWMMVSDGTRYSRFYPLDPRPEEINIFIIAHHLSHICRFTGATSRFYSVAEHSVLVSDKMLELTGAPAAGLEGLLHDAPEAIVNDINRPLKRTEEMAGYCDVEKKIWAQAIAPKYGLSVKHSKLLQEVDIRMCATEKRDLMPMSEDWPDMPEPYDDYHLQQDVSPAMARHLFVGQFATLMGEL